MEPLKDLSKLHVSAKKLPTQIVTFETPTPENDNLVAIEHIIFHEKKLEETSSTFSSLPVTPSSCLQRSTGILERCYNSLKNMENFWEIFNKVKIDIMEIRVEKKILEQNNKQMRGMIRGILEALVLAQSQPNSNISSRIPSRSRSNYSAPLRRIVLQ